MAAHKLLFKLLRAKCYIKCLPPARHRTRCFYMNYLLSPPNNQVRQVLLSPHLMELREERQRAHIHTTVKRQGLIPHPSVLSSKSPFQGQPCLTVAQTEKAPDEWDFPSTKEEGWVVGAFARRSQTREKGRGHTRHREQHEQRHGGQARCISHASTLGSTLGKVQ